MGVTYIREGDDEGPKEKKRMGKLKPSKNKGNKGNWQKEMECEEEDDE